MWVGPVLWAILVSAAGAAVFPLAFRLFPGLSDRGYAVSRALGLLLWGYLFWLLTSLGILVNMAGGILAALLLVAAAGILVWRKNGGAIWAWLRQNRRTVLMVEIIFYASFLLGLLLRAMEPAALGTEKPMELAFINAFLRSDGMPPLDPWLAGYGISYYYFGYVLVGMLAKLSGVGGGVAFNLGIGLVFSLGAVGAYGVVYNLYTAYRPEGGRALRRMPLLGPLFVLILSNVEGFLEFIHGRGVFWTQTSDGAWTSKFWNWVNLDNLKLPPPGNTAPGQLRHWWWWRASRVVADFDLAGNFREVIDEFPFFSFFLADLHPHVLVIPFVFVALSISLNLYLKKEEKTFTLFGSELLFSPLTFLLGAVVFGGLGFLNLWDFPWYVVIFAGAHALRKAGRDGWSLERLKEFLILLLAFGISGVLAYLPFYLSFSSQAGGILPNVINPTRGIHLWIMFGTLFVPLLSFLIYLVKQRSDRKGLIRGLVMAAILFAVLLILSVGFANVAAGGGLALLQNEGGNWFLQMNGAETLGQLLTEGLARRGLAWFSAVTLIAIIGLGFAVLWPRQKSEDRPKGIELAAPHRFAVLLAVIAGGLVLAPEFFYLRDLFGTRMNTIFKFYYQAWILWAVAAAYGSAVLLSLPKKKLAGNLFPVIFAAVLLVGLTYPVMALNTRITSYLGQIEPTLELDAAANPYYLNPDEQAAAAWLRQAPLGTLVEAVHPGGGSYTHYARISMNTGQPALLGWVGHEQQWRGGNQEIGSRQADIERLYITGSWVEAAEIIEQYGIRYLVVGNLERTTYNVNEEKFFRNLEPAFQQGSVTIYHTHLLED